MKTRLLLPVLIPVVAILVFTFSLRNTRTVTAEISPADNVQPDISNVQPDITVSKTNDADGDDNFNDDETTTPANPLSAEYQLEITNNGLEVVTVTAVVDTHHDLVGSTCQTLVGTTLPVGVPVTCTFTGAFSNDNASETNTASVTVEDSQSITATVGDTTTVHTIDIQPDITVEKTNDANDDGLFSDDEMTTTANPLSAEYQLTITNNTAESLTITSIDDSDHDLAGSDCASLIDTQLAAGSFISCTFTGTYSNDNMPDIVNTATVTVEDDENNSDSGSDTTTVHTIDIQPAIAVAKTNDANDDGEFSDEETATLGATVTFQVEITNETAEAVMIDSIVDSIHGANLELVSSTSPSCASLIGTSVTASGSALCYFDGVIAADDGASEINTVTVAVSDDDGNNDSNSDNATVNVADIIPAITVAKDNDADGNDTYSNVEQLPVGISEVTFRLIIGNDTPEAVTIDSIVDSVHGANAALTTTSPGLTSCAALISASLAGDQTETCYFDGTIGSNVPSETNSITVSVSDNENNSDSAGDTSTVLVPRLAVSKTPDNQMVLIGNDANFSISVTNNGGVALTNVIVTDAEAPDCNRTFASLNAGANESYTCTRTGVTADFTNEAIVRGLDTLGGTVEATDTAAVDVINPQIAIAKNPDVQEIPKGGSAQFSITVENTGDVTLTNVSVADPQATGCNASIGTLAAGADHTYTCSLSNVSEDFLNEATASGSHALGGSVTADDTAFVDVNEPNIAIFKNPAVQTIQKGDTATFNIVVVNTGEVNLTDVEVSDPLAPNCDRNIGDLAAGGDFPYTCQAMNVEDRLVNVATVTGINPASGNPVSDSDVAVVEILDATVTVQANPASLPEPGGTVDYTLTVINEGSQGMTLTELNSSRFGELSDPANGSVHNNTCAFTNPPIIDAGDDYTCSFEADEHPRQPGDYPLAVTAVFDNGVATATGNTTITITNLPASIAVTLTATPAVVQAPGGNVSLKVRIDNSSPADSVTIDSLEDSKLGDLNGLGTCSRPQTILPGDFYECTVVVTVTGQTGDSEVHAVTASGEDDDNGSVSNTGQVTIPITAPPGFRLYLPLALNNVAVGEPNNNACQAYSIGLNQIFHFLADDQADWYRFVLPESGNVVVELRNFVPQSGQLLVYRDSSGCGSLTNSDLIGQNGNFSATKIVHLGQRPAGQYYVRIINDGALNNKDPYQLQVIVTLQN